MRGTGCGVIYSEELVRKLVLEKTKEEAPLERLTGSDVTDRFKTGQ